MKAYKITTENLVYGVAFILALGLRLFQLGAGPLSDIEAGWALQALGLAHAGPVMMGAQPAYILLTSQLFYIFSDTNFLARFFPALAGSLIIWLPYCFRSWMGDSSWLHRAGLVMAFGLAIDPGLVSISRQAGSLMPAISFTLLALACLYNRRMILTGIFTGLALLSGLAFLQGLLILGISWGFFQLVNKKFDQAPPEDESGQPSVEPISSRSIGIALAALGGTILVVGTLFLRFPQGLGALAETIPAYINALIKPSGIPALRLPASLLVYQTLLLILGIVSAVHVWFGDQADNRTRQMVAGMSIWFIVALLLPLLYVGRQVADMAWALIPLWALAAIEISRLLITDQEDTLTRLVSAGLGLLIIVLTVVSWINLLSIGRYQVNIAVYWAIIIGAFLLGLIAMLLVASVWSASAARLGVVWALCFILGLQLISNSWGMTIVRQNGAQELWPIPATTGQADQLSQTLSDLSSRNTGLKDQLEIVALVDSPALQWELRQFPNSRFATTLAASESPPVVISLKEAQLPSLAEKYRGQDFVWRLNPDPAWQGVLPPNIINWLAFRQPPLSQDQIILWARSDMFPGGTLGTSDSAVP
jgi:4-amino-4-deoxy-L-arabinose transferase-like glycosyltransferase